MAEDTTAETGEEKVTEATEEVNLYDKTEQENGQEEAVAEKGKAKESKPEPEDGGKTEETQEEATDEAVMYEEFKLPEGMSID